MKLPACPTRAFSYPLVHILAWSLALTRPVVRAAVSPILAGDARNTANETVTVFEDLPEGFHNDVDSITVAVGGHHTCALEYRPGVDFGGPVRCWGSDNWGQSSPSDEIFVQVRAQLGNRPCRGWCNFLSVRHVRLYCEDTACVWSIESCLVTGRYMLYSARSRQSSSHGGSCTISFY